MLALRRLLALGLGLHGLVHAIGFAVSWRLIEPEGFAYSTEIVGDVDIGTLGTRILGVMWILAGAGFAVTAERVFRNDRSARNALVVAAAFSAVVCLLQVDVAWRGLAIDLVLLLGATLWGLIELEQRDRNGLAR